MKEGRVPPALSDAFMVHSCGIALSLTEALDEVPAMLLDDLQMLYAAEVKRR